MVKCWIQLIQSAIVDVCNSVLALNKMIINQAALSLNVPSSKLIFLALSNQLLQKAMAMLQSRGSRMKVRCHYQLMNGALVLCECITDP